MGACLTPCPNHNARQCSWNEAAIATPALISDKFGFCCRDEHIPDMEFGSALSMNKEKDPWKIIIHEKCLGFGIMFAVVVPVIRKRSHCKMGMKLSSIHGYFWIVCSQCPALWWLSVWYVRGLVTRLRCYVIHHIMGITILHFHFYSGFLPRARLNIAFVCKSKNLFITMWHVGKF